MILDTNDAILLVGAGPVGKVILSRLATITRRIVAADGGANRLISAGLRPELVIGDLDSVGAVARHQIPPSSFHLIRDQATTDFEKCLNNIRAPLILAAGFLDGRIDHALAAMSAISTRPEQRIILIGRSDICFLARANLCLDLKKGSRLSLFPMARVCGKSDGLEWNVDDLVFAPNGQIGTSNRVIGPVRLDFPEPGMLVILPQSAIAAAITALGSPAQP